jgi:hypothetical protein
VKALRDQISKDKAAYREKTTFTLGAVKTNFGRFPAE